MAANTQMCAHYSHPNKQIQIQALQRLEHTHKLCHIHKSSEKQEHKQQAMQKVYFQIDSPSTKLPLTSETGPITQHIFYIYDYMAFSSLPAITAAPTPEPKEKVLLNLFLINYILNLN